MHDVQYVIRNIHPLLHAYKDRVRDAHTNEEDANKEHEGIDEDAESAEGQDVKKVTKHSNNSCAPKLSREEQARSIRDANR